MPSSGVQTCARSEEHTSELQSHDNLVCRLLLEKKTLQLRGRCGASHLPPLHGWAGRPAYARLLDAQSPPRLVSAPAPHPPAFCFLFFNGRGPPRITHFPPPAPFPT